MIETITVVVAILLANSILNIVVWAYITNKALQNFKEGLAEVQKTLKLVRGDVE